MSKLVPLTRGKFAVVDDEDYERVIALAPWYCLKGGYAARSDYQAGTGKSKMVYLHRFILEASKGQVVDHANGDRLDNRRSNIRLCTHSENNTNRKCDRQRKSRFKGVYFVKGQPRRPWVAYLRTKNKNTLYLGAFAFEEDAAKAFDVYAKTFHGKFAKLNYPEAECLLTKKL